jgi:hypothetical protein
MKIRVLLIVALASTVVTQATDPSVASYSEMTSPCTSVRLFIG